MPQPSQTNDSPVVAIVVTYGDRSKNVIATLESLTTVGNVEGVVLVFNGASEGSRAEVEDWKDRHSEVELGIVDLSRNFGSAVGFGSGLKEARAKYPGRSVLLMDDDLEVERATIHEMQAAVASAQKSHPHSAVGVLGSRPGLPNWVDASQATFADFFRFMTPGYFQGFDLIDKLRGAKLPVSPAAKRTELRETLPTAIYGGLYLSSGAVALGVNPRNELVLYCDDLVFGEDLISAGAILVHCPTAVVREQFTWRDSADEASGRSIFHAVETPAREIWRLQYDFRNVAWASARRARHSGISSSIRLWVNVFARFSIIGIAGIAKRNPRVAIKLIRASMAGLRGRLGETYPLPQPHEVADQLDNEKA